MKNQKSKVAQQGYDLLMLLAISDKHYHSKEASKIHDFIKMHYHVHTIDVKTLEYYQNLNEEERLNKIVNSAQTFEDNEENKKMMIEFVLGIIFADNKFLPEEKVRFKILEKFWNFDLDSYLDSL